VRRCGDVVVRRCGDVVVVATVSCEWQFGGCYR
jgi:hypothetical protein